MKKSIVFLAAAALTLGMISCTDEMIDPTEFVDGVEGFEEPVAGPMVKSAADLAGTEWNYTVANQFAIDPFSGDTVEFDMSAMSFTLTFDEEYAQLAFPESMVMLTLDEDFTVQEVEGMHFAYTYDMTTTSGNLVATDYDITGEPIEFEIPFTYDEANDAINIRIEFGYDEMSEETFGFDIVFQRN